MTPETPRHNHPPGAERHLVERLALRRIDRDIFTGWCHAGAPLRAFGGQVAAQALVAAGSTVEDRERSVHSLHGYFLRPGRTTDHIVYIVDRPRDGRSYSTRRVRAVQYGETIFMMSASFALHRPGPSHQKPPAVGADGGWMGSIPSPEDLNGEDILSRVDVGHPTDSAHRGSEMHDAGFPDRQLLELCFIDPAVVRRITPFGADQMTWVRSRETLPDGPLIHVCTVTYVSDLTLVETVLGPHGGSSQTQNLDKASIDHAMWFHAPFRADEWLLLVTDSPVARDGRGFARGQFFKQDGILVASVAQEALVRERSTPRQSG
ncbi:MAG: thioesterase family protein [Candidatus Nanopelagicales bacterium]|nr:thioesterase family protein [Candidatus Nanopelagicales bacterium]